MGDLWQHWNAVQRSKTRLNDQMQEIRGGLRTLAFAERHLEHLILEAAPGRAAWVTTMKAALVDKALVGVGAVSTTQEEVAAAFPELAELLARLDENTIIRVDDLCVKAWKQKDPCVMAWILHPSPLPITHGMLDPKLVVESRQNGYFESVRTMAEYLND